MITNILLSLGVVLVLYTVMPVALMEKDVSPCSYGVPGLPGMPGSPGKDGRDGLKGPKGERGTPATSGTHGAKGEKGSRGTKGTAGKNGPLGPPGPEGDKGTRGQMGEVGQSGNHKHLYQSAFTVARLTADYPSKNARVLFTKEISNKMKDYNTETGAFTCRIPGLYYFTFHATQTYNLCIILYREGAKMASFCEHMSNRAQVTSGGVLLALKKGQQVWLEVNDYNGLFAGSGEDSVFTGFLLFPD